MKLRLGAACLGLLGLLGLAVWSPLSASGSLAAAETGAHADAAPAAASASAHDVTVPGSPFILAGSHTTATPTVDCTEPNGVEVLDFHCYTPQQIRAAYGVDTIAKFATATHLTDYGQGQTIVLVDSYGSPTAATDLQTFHDTFFPDLPTPVTTHLFTQVFPLGDPQYKNTHGKGESGSGATAAAGWAGEATLDVEWAYAIAPEANIVLLAVPPSETEGVQGYPNLFKAITQEISATPPGTVFSMSFSSTEQTFGGAAAAQTAKFTKVFERGLAKDDNFFDAAGDTGTINVGKQKRKSRDYPYPTVEWPATSPNVVAVGGTQLQYGWKWDPTSDTAFEPTGTPDPAYWHSTTTATGGQAVWNESWGDLGTNGGVSTIYPEPTWQKSVGTFSGRAVPDTSWDAAVNGGVLIWITAFPDYNCLTGSTTGCWTVSGGTSAATPQTAALVALADAARAHDGKGPIGFLDPILYSTATLQSAYTHIGPHDYGSAPKSSTVTDIDDAGDTLSVTKSVGTLVDNQMWGTTVAGYYETTPYNLATGWGAPKAATFVAALLAHA